MAYKHLCINNRSCKLSYIIPQFYKKVPHLRSGWAVVILLLQSY
jgi:hypothetical protein